MAGYEGGGVFRHSFLTSSPSCAHVQAHGLHADISVSGPYTYPASPSAGVVAAQATLLAHVDIEGDCSGSTPTDAVFTLLAADGAVAATATAPAATLSPSAPTARLSALLSFTQVQAWSVGRPYQYTLSVALGAGAHTRNVSLGLRSVRFDADEGVFVNEQRVRFRSFCDHESFSATGMAVPDRVNLFRYQAMRGMGGNGRRFSHNPPAPALLDLADRLGLLTLDENRVFSLGLAGNMQDLVERDRNHASVIFWCVAGERRSARAAEEVGRPTFTARASSPFSLSFIHRAGPSVMSQGATTPTRPRRNSPRRTSSTPWRLLTDRVQSQATCACHGARAPTCLSTLTVTA